MINDPIIKEIRDTRQKIFKKCDNDLNKLLDWLSQQEEKDRKRNANQKREEASSL